MSRKLIDLTGERFGRLTVIERCGSTRVGVDKEAVPVWKCLCDCGTERIVMGHNLRSGGTQSCGCLRNERAGRKRREP